MAIVCQTASRARWTTHAESIALLLARVHDVASGLAFFLPPLLDFLMASGGWSLMAGSLCPDLHVRQQDLTVCTISGVIGNQIRALRAARGLTLAGLAGDRLSVSMVSKIERGLVRPSLSTLEYLAGQLGATAAELIGGQTSASGADEVTRGTAALGVDEPETALAAVDGVRGEAADAVRVQALLALGRDDEALAAADEALRWAPLTGRSEEIARLHLARGEALARAGRGDQAQAAFGRALERAPDDAFDVRASALIALADAAERAGSRSTARNFLRQAQVPLTQAASPARRAAALRRRAAGEPEHATTLLAAAAELAALARAATLRAETAARLAQLDPDALPSTAFREASDQMAHRSIRRDRGG